MIQRSAWWLVVGVCLMVGGCDSQPKSDQAVGTDGAAGDKPLRIAVIPKGTTHDFWKSVHAGAQRAADELENVEIIWKGPLSENDTESQINVMQDFITQRVDGICLAPNDSQSLVNVVQSAKEQGVATVVFDSGLDDEETPVGYVATDNHAAGALAARQLAETMGGQGNVILLRYKSGSESTHQREEGFLEALAKDYPDIKVISENQYTDTTAEGSLAKAQELLLKYRDQVNGIFAVCEPNSVGVLGALEESELAGKVKFIAFDSSPRLIAAMNEDKVHGIVLQDPETMGYEAIKMLVAHLRGETISQRHVATGQYVATAKNQSEPKIKALLHPAQVDN